MKLLHYSRTCAFFLTLGIIGISIGGANAESLDRTVSYFQIGGNTAQEIEAQLLKYGPPLESSGLRHPGATKFRFLPEIAYAETDDQCRVVSAKVKIIAKVILPKWRAPAPDLGARLYWSAISTDIVRHEESHLVIARNYARSRERALLALAPAKDCQKLAATAKAAQTKAAVQHDKNQKRFDRIEGISLDKRLVSRLQQAMEQMKRAKAKGN